MRGRQRMLPGQEWHASASHEIRMGCKLHIAAFDNVLLACRHEVQLLMQDFAAFMAHVVTLLTSGHLPLADLSAPELARMCWHCTYPDGSRGVLGEATGAVAYTGDSDSERSATALMGTAKQGGARKKASCARVCPADASKVHAQQKTQLAPPQHSIASQDDPSLPPPPRNEQPQPDPAGSNSHRVPGMGAVGSVPDCSAQQPSAKLQSDASTHQLGEAHADTPSALATINSSSSAHSLTVMDASDACLCAHNTSSLAISGELPTKPGNEQTVAPARGHSCAFGKGTAADTHTDAASAGAAEHAQRLAPLHQPSSYQPRGVTPLRLDVEGTAGEAGEGDASDAVEQYAPSPLAQLLPMLQLRAEAANKAAAHGSQLQATLGTTLHAAAVPAHVAPTAPRQVVGASVVYSGSPACQGKHSVAPSRKHTAGHQAAQSSSDLSDMADKENVPSSALPRKLTRYARAGTASRAAPKKVAFANPVSDAACCNAQVSKAKWLAGQEDLMSSVKACVLAAQNAAAAAQQHIRTEAKKPASATASPDAQVVKPGVRRGKHGRQCGPLHERRP